MSHWEAAGKSDNWYTPVAVFNALGVEFDLDVAGKHISVSKVPAKRIIEADSLSLNWEGLIWMNPPFGGRNGITPWLRRFVRHGNGVALTPDRTSAPWFQESAKLAQALLFTKKLRFVRPDGTEGKSPSNGTALWAMGGVAKAALERAAASNFGVLVVPGS